MVMKFLKEKLLDDEVYQERIDKIKKYEEK